MKKLVDAFVNYLGRYVDEGRLMKLSPLHNTNGECVILFEDEEGRRWSSGIVLDYKYNKLTIISSKQANEDFKEWVKKSRIEFLHLHSPDYYDQLGPFIVEIDNMNTEKTKLTKAMEKYESENTILSATGEIVSAYYDDEEISIPNAARAIYCIFKSLRTRVMNSINVAIEKEKPSCEISLDSHLSRAMSKELEILGYKVLTSDPDDNGDVLMEIIWFED